MKKTNQRGCTIFYCDQRRGGVCCADCGYNPRNNGTCRNPCLNHPDRCKCVTEPGKTGRKEG